MAKDDSTLGLYQTEVQTVVSFTAFMTAVVVFFTGLILTTIKNYDISIKVPVSFLLISIFGFLFSTLIYTNAATEISARRLKQAKEYIFWGDVLSEYLGVYMLVLSMPLVINVLVADEYLSFVALASSVGGLIIYHFLHFSIIERHFKEKYDKLSAVLIAFAVLLFLSQIYSFYFVQLSALFIVYIISITYLAARKAR